MRIEKQQKAMRRIVWKQTLKNYFYFIILRDSLFMYFIPTPNNK